MKEQKRKEGAPDLCLRGGSFEGEGMFHNDASPRPTVQYCVDWLSGCARLQEDTEIPWTGQNTGLDTQTVTKTPQYDYRDEQKHRAHFWIHWIVNIYRAV